MRLFSRRASIVAAAVVAAALTALALTFVPGAQATKGKQAAPPDADTLLYHGATTVQLDPAPADALTSLGISVAPTRPAYAGKTGISFPISFGVVDANDLTGQIRHFGGLAFTQGKTTVYLSRFFIDIGGAPSLSGRVGAAPGTGGRAELFDLDLSNLKVDADKNRITLSGVTLKLTKGAADALNAAFGGGQTPFAEGLVVGTATVKAKTWTTRAAWY